MSTTADVAGGPARRRVSPRLVLAALAVVVVAAMALDTTYKEPGDATATGRQAFDPEQYGADTFPRVQRTIESDAVPLGRLIAAIERDPDAAGERYGKRQGTSPWNFATRGEGVAGAPENGLLPVRVRGVGRDTTVSLQIGPAINGTSLRDAVGFIEFGQFVNQVEYAGAATALNDQVKTRVLQGIDRDGLEGRRVSFIGAFTLITSSVVTVTPTALEVAG